MKVLCDHRNCKNRTDEGVCGHKLKIIEISVGGRCQNYIPKHLCGDCLNFHTVECHPEMSSVVVPDDEPCGRFEAKEAER